MLRTVLCWILVGLLGLGLSAPANAALLAKEDSSSADTLGELREKAFTATNQGDFALAETYWTEILKQLPDNPAVWSNRGNARVSQNKLDGAIADYNRAIELSPESPDPYLNRGTAWEGLQHWERAIADYNHVLELDPDDAAAYNNRGNAEAGMGQWEQAIADYQYAADLAKDFAFARANHALATYEVGRTSEALREMRNIVRKYPRFADMRAALTAALWAEGKQGEAESNWYAALGLDSRYRNIDWVMKVRRWPPAITQALNKFLKLQ
ncbi:MAG: tetratricopeptide repeat protein [Kaiparowitsia implicata GSE-PSE-MK54-09C]|jgi:tetratricopeptide (TPR) repeat protein|nr:tetratricopeptide repeat protein [Kaiparowitsia implicata GSE-PSE-MK54-09C]